MSVSSAPQPSVGARWIARIIGLRSPNLRVASLTELVANTSIPEVANAFDDICCRAHAGSPSAREVLSVVVAWCHEPASALTVLALHEEANTRSLKALVGLLGALTSLPSSASLAPNSEGRIPDYGRGRALTLGERKALARVPSRRLFDRLLSDPHPDVIRHVLNNSVTTEDDVVRLVSKRPNLAGVIEEVARHPKWNVRSRIRLAIVLNPYTAPQLAVPLVSLLLRQGLTSVLQQTELCTDVRDAARLRLDAMNQETKPREE